MGRGGHDSRRPRASGTSATVSSLCFCRFYPTALGLGPFEVGVVATAALLGSALTTLGIGLLGARVDQRHLLVAASGLMVLTGIAFALSNDYWVVLLVAAIGTINPSAGTVSIFVPHRACAAVARCGRCRAHAHVRALQPGRRARRGDRRVRLGQPRAARPARDRAPRRVARHVPLLYAMLGIAGGACYRALPWGRPAAETSR